MREMAQVRILDTEELTFSIFKVQIQPQWPIQLSLDCTCQIKLAPSTNSPALSAPSAFSCLRQTHMSGNFNYISSLQSNCISLWPLAISGHRSQKKKSQIVCAVRVLHLQSFVNWIYSSVLAGAALLRRHETIPLEFYFISPFLIAPLEVVTLATIVPNRQISHRTPVNAMRLLLLSDCCPATKDTWNYWNCFAILRCPSAFRIPKFPIEWVSECNCLSAYHCPGIFSFWAIRRICVDFGYWFPFPNAKESALLHDEDLSRLESVCEVCVWAFN